jgi:hypothetical protein
MTTQVTQTLKEKVEDAHDKILGVFSTGNSAIPIATLEDFMKNFTPGSTLVKDINKLFNDVQQSPRTGKPVSATDIKSHLFTTLLEIKGISKVDIANKALHTDGKSFKPTYLMAMFVCGLIRLNIAPFENWLTLTGSEELDYIREFLTLFEYPTEIVVYSDSTNAFISIDSDGDEKRVIPDKLFLTSSIPDSAKNVVIMDSLPETDPWKSIKTSFESHDTFMSDPLLWYVYVRQDPPDGDTFVFTNKRKAKCIGVLLSVRNRSYLFGYNFPKKGGFTEDYGGVVDLWKQYSTEPYEVYASFLQHFLLEKDTKPAFINDDTAFISNGSNDKPWLIYVHVLVMGVYGGNRNFYARKAYRSVDTTTTNALVAGKTCVDYRSLLTHVDESPIPLTITEAMDENVMERLANAHLDLMRKNAAFTFNGSVIDENYDDTLNATCPVKYDWVFRDEKLSKCAGWISTIKQELTVKSTRNKDVLDPELGVFRRILHCMDQNLDDADELKVFVRKFKPAEVKMGAQVDGDPHKHIAVDLYQYGMDKGIFTSKSKKEDFLSKDPLYRDAMQKYFEGDWHPDNVFGKYLVYNDNTQTYKVRDCLQIGIDNENVTDLSADITEKRAPSGGSSTISFHDGYSSDTSSSSGGSLPGIRGALPRGGKPTGQKSGTKKEDVKLPPILEKLRQVAGTYLDENKREEGGLDKIFNDLDSLATVDGKNTEDQAEKIKEIKDKMNIENEKFMKEINLLTKTVDTLTKELEEIKEMAKKEKDELDEKLKSVLADKDKLSQELNEALAREAELVKEKGEMDAKMKTLSGEKDTLTAEVTRLTKELEDSQKKATEDADKIRELTERVGEHEKEIARLMKEIEDMKTEKKKLLASDASKQAELDALAVKDKELKEALEREKQLLLENEALEKERQRLQDVVDSEKIDISIQTQEKIKLMDEARKLRETIAEYERQVTEITEKLQKGILEHERQVTTRIWKIHDKVDDSVQKKLTASELLVLLQNKKYIEFRDAVKKGAGEVDKKEYNLPALFLIYESIGGTWSLFERLADQTQPSEFMTEKLIESLRLFQTIETHDEHLLDTYTNQYFRKFLETFQCLAIDPDTNTETIDSF